LNVIFLFYFSIMSVEIDITPMDNENNTVV
jgi:hypothetical protein